MSVYQPVPKEAVLAARDWREAVLGIFDLRITDFRVAPTRVAVGEEVSISGLLQEHVPLLCIWGTPAEIFPIKLIVDTTTVSTRDTASDGSFRFRWYPKETGTFWVRTRCDGDLLHNPCESPEVTVTVITKEEKEAEERMFWLMVGGAGIATVAVVGGVIYYVEESKRREMLMLALKR